MNKEEHMMLNATQQDSDANNANDYFDALRQKNYEASFDGVENFVLKNKDKFHDRRRRRPVRNWQWAVAVLFPLMLVLACTKTERNEPVGNTISFSVPANDDAARQAFESLAGELQPVVLPDRQKPGYLSFTCFIPAQHNRSVDAVVQQLKSINGIADLRTMPVNAQVRESLLSQLGSKIFSTHIDATALRDDEVQSALMRQLKEQGFNNISVTVNRNEKGVRTLELHPGKGGPNISIDVSRDDKGTRMVLQEEKRTAAKNLPVVGKPQPDFGNMTDAQVRDYVRRQYGKDLRDEAIRIIRTAKEIAIDIKKSDEKVEIIHFRLH
jgi:hypothetical protein